MEKFNPQKINQLKRIDKLFRFFYFSPKNKKTYPPIVKDGVKEIVIMAMFMIGDTIMGIPALKTVKKNFPAAKITLVCGSHVNLILQEQGIVDKFIIVNCPWVTHNYSFKNLINFFTRLKVINKTNYDLAIDFRGDWRNIFYMNFVNAVRKISFGYTGGAYMLTDVIKADDSIKHYIDEWLYLLKSIGCEVNDEDRFPVLNLTTDEKKMLAGFKVQNGLNNKFVIGIHPGASLATRKWDEAKYAELLVRLNKINDVAFVIFEGPGEGSTVNHITNRLGAANIKPIIVNGSLENYLTLINCCNLLVCNDSSAGHIAGAFSIPTIVIFGKADPETVKPYNKNHLQIISQMHDPSMQNKENGNKEFLEATSVDEVFKTAIALISILHPGKKIPKSNDVIV